MALSAFQTWFRSDMPISIPCTTLQALMDGTCDALMEDVYRIKQLTTNQNHSYFGKFVAVRFLEPAPLVLGVLRHVAIARILTTFCGTAK